MPDDQPDSKLTREEIDEDSFSFSSKKILEIEPDEKKIHTGADVASFLAYWRIDPRYRNVLYYRKRPLNVDEITFDLDPFGWRAGGGWPEYTTPCPHPEHGGSGFDYPRFRRHCVVAVIGGQRRNLWQVCTRDKDFIFGPTRGGVSFEVNDNGAADNTGFFDVNVYEFKPPLTD